MLDLINLTYFGSQTPNAQQPTTQSRTDFQGGTNAARFAQEAPSVSLAGSVANDVGQPGQLLLRTLQ